MIDCGTNWDGRLQFFTEVYIGNIFKNSSKTLA